MICACGHGPASHDAPAGPCHSCTPPLQGHRYTPMGEFADPLETATLAHLDSMETP